ncbi:hypothetical protein DRQ53_15765, partial [bacterium]
VLRGRPDLLTLQFIYHFLVPTGLLVTSGLVLLIPDAFGNWPGGRVWRLTGWASLVVCLLFGVAVASFLLRFQGFSCLLRELKNPEPYRSVMLFAWGRQQIDMSVWGLQDGEDSHRLLAQVEDPPCEWPIEIRRSSRGSRFVVIDSRFWVVAVIDLRDALVIRTEYALPSVETLRIEFGGDLVRVSTIEAAIEEEASE